MRAFKLLAKVVDNATVTGIVRQRNEGPSPSLEIRSEATTRTSQAATVYATRSPGAASGRVALVVRDVMRDPEGMVGRVVGHLLVEAGCRAGHVSVSLVGIDRSGTTTIAERHGRSDLELSHHGRSAERLDFSIDLQRRMTPAFQTPLGERWWELRAALGGDRADAVNQFVEVPSVRRTVSASIDPATPIERRSWARMVPAMLHPSAHALDPATKATGQACVRSRGDWGVVDVPRNDDQRWRASIVQFERLEGVPGDGSSGRQRREVVYSRSLVGGPNTLAFDLPDGVAPSHVGPLLATWYELRVHTDDGRQLGARHSVEVCN